MFNKLQVFYRYVCRFWQNLTKLNIHKNTTINLPTKMNPRYVFFSHKVYKLVLLTERINLLCHIILYRYKYRFVSFFFYLLVSFNRRPYILFYQAGNHTQTFLQVWSYITYAYFHIEIFIQ